MEIRPLVASDFPALARQVERARAAGEFSASSDATGTFLMKSLEFMPHPVAAAFEGDAVIGFVSPEVKIVVVDPEHRRRGIGRQLVEAGVEIEVARGRSQLLMGVAPDDEAGKAFLSATGFAFHSTLWDLGLPADRAVEAPAWPPELLVRTFDRTRDPAPWVSLFNAAFADHATPLQVDLASVLALNDDPTIVDDDLAVLEDRSSGALIGFCATQPEREAGVVGPRAEIWTVGVHPDYQGHGLGRQLLRWGIARLRGLGATEIVLSVNGRNEGALGLYLSEGFERRRTRDRWARPAR